MGSANDQSSPVRIDGLADGTATIRMRSGAPLLPTGSWFAQVGSGSVTVTEAYDVSLTSGNTSKNAPVAHLTDPFSVYARTPELGSLALFGAGAAGMAGYGLTRLRAGRERKPK